MELEKITTLESGEVTVNSNCFINVAIHMWYKVGNIVIFYIAGAINYSAIDSDKIVASDLPKATHTFLGNVGLMSSSSEQLGTYCRIYNTGELELTSNLSSSNTYTFISGCYISAE